MRNKMMYFMLSAALFAVIMSAAGAEGISAKVTAVTQADVLTVVREGTSVPQEVRLFGVDCPEPGQPFAEEAKKFVTEKVLNQTVTIEVLTQDKEGKDVVAVVLADSTKLNEALLQAGFAWWDSENTPDERALRGLCAPAVVAQAGLWKDAAPLSPWDYRRSHNLPAVEYRLTKEKEKAAEPPKEEPKVLSAKGTEVYKGGFSVDLSKIKFDQQVDPMDLMAKHMPTPALDAGGKPIGMSVPNINQIPYASQLGFQDGDVISGVNGMPLTDMSQAMGMYEQLKNAKQFDVQVIRGGKPVTISIHR